MTSEICAVPLQLVKNLQLIWSTLACGYAIDSKKFGQLCQETKDIYFDEQSKVSWYNIPPTLHKVLEHGQALIENCILPIGLTNEEASEGNNKILRNVRLHHSRKTSWQDGMFDLYHRLMDISDPIIVEKSTTKRKSSTQKKPLSKEILFLLQSPEMLIGEVETD